MSRNRIIGWMLIALSVVVLVALVVNNHILWMTVDVLMVVVCSVGGVMLIRGKIK